MNKWVHSQLLTRLTGDTAMPVLHIHRQSGYLLGRDRKVADIPIDHPSCSKQHAVLQFRSMEYTVSLVYMSLFITKNRFDSNIIHGRRVCV